MASEPAVRGSLQGWCSSDRHVPWPSEQHAGHFSVSSRYPGQFGGAWNWCVAMKSSRVLDGPSVSADPEAVLRRVRVSVSTCLAVLQSPAGQTALLISTAVPAVADLSEASRL